MLMVFVVLKDSPVLWVRTEFWSQGSFPSDMSWFCYLGLITLLGPSFLISDIQIITALDTQ